MSKVVGITGGICAGKSTVSNHLRKLGATVVDMDKLAHELYLPGQEAYDLVVKQFGSSIVAADGTINRRALGSIVFSKPSEMQKLTSIMWPRVNQKLLEIIASHRAKGTPVLFAENALLFESAMDFIVDSIWVVHITKECAKKRLMVRNNLTEQEALQRIAAQMDPDVMASKGHVVIQNDRAISETEAETEKLYNKILQEVLSKKYSCNNDITLITMQKPAKKPVFNEAANAGGDDDDWETDPDATSIPQEKPSAQPFVSIADLRDQVLKEDEKAKASSSAGKQLADRKQYQKPLGK